MNLINTRTVDKSIRFAETDSVPTFPRGFTAYQEHVRNARLIAQLAREQGGDIRAERASSASSSTPADSISLRGIPAVGPGWAGGAIRATRPGDGLL
jgi:hypothetical protein